MLLAHVMYARNRNKRDCMPAPETLATPVRIMLKKCDRSGSGHAREVTWVPAFVETGLMF